MSLEVPRAAQKKKQYHADIVFCLDVTGSMQPCIDALKNNVMDFANDIVKDGKIDIRFGLVAYRNRHETARPEKDQLPINLQPWFFSPNFISSEKHPSPDKIGLTPDAEVLQGWLKTVGYCEAYGGGKKGPESTLDALYYALHLSDWRSGNTHRVIVLLTDADTCPTMVPSTYKRKADANVNRIIQDISTQMPHGILFMCAPRFPIYEQIAREAESADRMVLLNPVQQGTGMENVNFHELMNLLSKSIKSSIATAAMRHGRESS